MYHTKTQLFLNTARCRFPELTDAELIIAMRLHQMQKAACKGRMDILGNAIEFKIVFDEWFSIWLESGHWEERGRCKGQYVMSRRDDIGHYEVGNVFIQSKADNTKGTPKGHKFGPGPNIKGAETKRLKQLARKD